MKHINNAIDAVCKWLIRIGARRFKGAVIDVRIGDESYVLRKYWPKHDIKEHEEPTAELKTIRQKRITKVNQPEFWAEKSAQYNSPGFCDDYVALDTFEKRLP